eukprot:TRINITY_DN267_c0_g1_i11.p1 TRINITY_DN267_c0_g1~~TRINITY_DN267_c0_g1_i11.p1  ORF type:complete len:386 (+),score=175.35 TRINITY_DN267_c0_g1_i11:628-1785(+)
MEQSDVGNVKISTRQKVLSVPTSIHTQPVERVEAAIGTPGAIHTGDKLPQLPLKVQYNVVDVHEKAAGPTYHAPRGRRIANMDEELDVQVPETPKLRGNRKIREDATTFVQAPISPPSSEGQKNDQKVVDSSASEKPRGAEFIPKFRKVAEPSVAQNDAPQKEASITATAPRGNGFKQPEARKGLIAPTASPAAPEQKVKAVDGFRPQGREYKKPSMNFGQPLQAKEDAVEKAKADTITPEGQTQRAARKDIGKPMLPKEETVEKAKADAVKPQGEAKRVVRKDIGKPMLPKEETVEKAKADAIKPEGEVKRVARKDIGKPIQPKEETVEKAKADAVKPEGEVKRVARKDIGKPIQPKEETVEKAKADAVKPEGEVKAAKGEQSG